MTREELLHLVETERTNASWANNSEWWESVDKIYNWIEELEPVKEYEPTTDELLKEQQPKKGKWLPYGMCGDYKCSECGFKDERESKFCPNCGARMSYFAVRTLTWKVVGKQK